MDDLIIIGGSAASAAAAIYAKRRSLNFRMVYKEFGGEVATSGEIQNWPGIIETSGIELSAMFKKHIDSYKVQQEEGVFIEKVEKEGDEFKLFGEKNGEIAEYRAKTIILATGVHPRMLNIPGEKEYKNKGVSYCTVCDGPLFKDKTVAVIGGGNAALESAIMLKDIAEKVYLLTVNSEMQGEGILIEKVKQASNIEIISFAFTQEIKGDNYVKTLRYQQKFENSDKSVQEIKELDLDGVFIHIGQIPNSGIVGDDVIKNQFGEIIIDRFGGTNIEGLYAAGDVTDIPYKQIAIAVGQGVVAALSVVDYLNKRK